MLWLHRQVVLHLGQAVTNFSGVGTQCMSLPASWRPSAAALDTELYCAWRKSGCSNTSSADLRQASLLLYHPNAPPHSLPRASRDTVSLMHFGLLLHALAACFWHTSQFLHDVLLTHLWGLPSLLCL